MSAVACVLSLMHLIGLSLGVGAATVKLTLLLRCRADHGFVPVYRKVARSITRQIILGLVLLTLSGLGWLLTGYPLTPPLVVKLILVGTIWTLGPVIDNVVEPKFHALAPAAGEAASSGFLRIQRRYLTLEVAATALFYVVIFLWVLA